MDLYTVKGSFSERHSHCAKRFDCFSHYRNVACNRGKEEKANLIDSESLNVHIDYKKVSLCIILPLSNV